MHHLSVSEERDEELGDITSDFEYITTHPRLKHKVSCFLHALMLGGSIKYAAAQAGVAYVTALSWLESPEVNEYYQAIERELAAHSTNHLERAAGVAIDTLVHIMLQEQNITGVNHDTHVTVKACKILLDHYNLQQQNAALRGQVRDLERHLEEKNTGGQPDEIPPLRIVM